MKGNVGALVLIGLGSFFLLSNLNLINVSLFEIMRVWWPAILIVVGISLFFTNRERGSQDRAKDKD
ncbi:MAG TPA: DUF5668 domain-containing protein [Burkholderiaceae bacterium]|jgi:hypothetical protein|nr:DUF5668 domain-containing protein [Burkholderiaceae bacterium]